MGEKSKKRGEFGEEIVKQILKLIGWQPFLEGIDFSCLSPVSHAISTKGRATHGIDFVYHYNCPLFNNRQEFVLVSSKFNDAYPSNPTQRFKLHLKDIGQSLECFPKSPTKNNLKQSGMDPKYTGVIFWIDNNDTNDYDDLIERLTDFHVDNELDFDSVYLIDNKRIDFLYKSINHVKQRFSEANIEFYIPSTGNNNTIHSRQTSSPVLPVQYIVTKVLLTICLRRKQTIS